MRKAVFLLLLLLLLFLSVDAGQGRNVPLPELYKPAQILADDAHLYVVEFPTVSIYSLKDFKLIAKFGKQGEGPQEFKQYINVFFQDVPPDHLVISSIGKISFYSRDGAFIREIKIPFGGWTFQPLGDRFLGHTLGGDAKDGYKALNLYDSKLNKIKEIYRKEFFFDDSIKKRTLFVSNYRYWTYAGKIYVIAEDDFIIRIFDRTGKPLPSIVREDYQREKCTEAHKQSVLDFFKRDVRIRPHYERLKKQLQFPDYFPAVREMVIDEGKLYVLTYRRRNNENEFFIYDTEGKLLGRKYLPLHSPNGVTPYAFTIRNGVLYQVFENDEAEQWELHILPIK